MFFFKKITELFKIFSFKFGYWIILPILRIWLNGPMYLYGITFKNYGTFCHDSKPFNHMINLKRGIKYGMEKYEYIDILTPTEGKVNDIPIIYLHGGGWVCVKNEHLIHSLAALSRAGNCIYVVEYPKSPENTFPSALISVLKACNFLKKNKGYKKISFMGDSAGGNLATLAAAILTNNELMKIFQNDLKDKVLYSEMPDIDRIVSIYGILDYQSWKNTWTSFILYFCYSCYLPKSIRKNYKITSLCDIDYKYLNNYPETLLICGKQDGLLYSSRLAKKRLTKANCQCKLLEYPGVHGFYGIPIQWTNGYWKQNTLPATEEIISFFNKKNFKLSNKDVPFDWTLPFWIFLSINYPLYLIFQFVLYKLNLLDI